MEVLKVGDICRSQPQFQLSNDITRDAITGSKWVKQRPGNNASISVTFTVARAYGNPQLAQAAGILAIKYAAYYSYGILIHNYAYNCAGVALRQDKWIATIDSVSPEPMEVDTWFGEILDKKEDIKIYKAAWRSIEFQFTLTKPINYGQQ